MTEHQCHRCGHDLHADSESALVYCSYCGAPQVRLSEELREGAEQLRRAQDEAVDNGPAAVFKPGTNAEAIVWKHAIRLAAAVAGALAVLTILLPPMMLLFWAWTPLASAVVLSLYAARYREVRLTARAGARLGLMCGLLIVGGLLLVNCLELDMVRFGLHRGADFDANVSSMAAQLRAQIVAQSGQDAAAGLNLLAIPEFRAGFFLAGFGLLATVILMLGTAGGAFAGYMRSRKLPV